MMNEVKKAVILAAGLSTRFLPLSKIVPKEVWPVVDKPMIQHIVEEVRDAGLSQIIFVLNPERKHIFSYFKKDVKLEKILKKSKKEKSLTEVRTLHELGEALSFSYALQQRPLGDGHAILRAKAKIRKEPFAVLFADDIVESKTSCLAQLLRIFKTCQRPVVALYKVPKEKVSAYGTVEVEKIANRLFKIKKIIEKPSPEKAPSDLVIVGKYILTPEIFDYLKAKKPNPKGEIILAETLDNVLKDGKIIYGYEIEGRWLECGTKENWLKSHLYLSLKHPQYGEELKRYLKEIIS